MKRRSKQAFTLLEITIAVLIISLIGVAVSWQIKRMVSTHQMQSAAAKLCIALQEAQLLAVIHQTDFAVHFFKEKGVFYYRTETAEPLSILDKKKKPLPGAHFLTLQGKQVDSFSLNLFSSGRIEPPIVVGFYADNPKHKPDSGLWVDLRTPVQIRLCHHRPAPLNERMPAFPKETRS